MTGINVDVIELHTRRLVPSGADGGVILAHLDVGAASELAHTEQRLGLEYIVCNLVKVGVVFVIFLMRPQVHQHVLLASCPTAQCSLREDSALHTELYARGER